VRRKFYDLEVALESSVAAEALERIAGLYAINKADPYIQSRYQNEGELSAWKPTYQVVRRTDCMDAHDLEVLKTSRRRELQIRSFDGEVLIATVFLISDEEQDVMVELVSSNRPDKYEAMGVHPALLFKFRDIDSVQILETPSSTETNMPENQ
jgi:hypothetical protein